MNNNNKERMLERPKSRLESRRKALGNITDGIDQDDLFILTIDNELRADNLNKVRKSIIAKDYENAIDDIIKLNKKIKPDDEENLYSLVLEDLDSELKDILKPRDNKTNNFIKKNLYNSCNSNNERKVIAPSKCIPIKRKSQDFIDNCSFSSTSPA